MESRVLKGARKLLVWLLVLAAIGMLVLYLAQDFLVFPGRGLYRGNTPEWQSRMAALSSQGFIHVEFQSKDGALVHAIFAPTPNQPAPGLLWMHARDANITEINQHVKPLSMLAGLNVLAMEYRGYGNSIGDTTEENLLADAEAAIEYMLQRDDIAGKRILVGGNELGANLAFKVAGRKKVSGVIAVSPLPDMETAVARKIPFVPIGFLLSQKFALLPALSAVTAPVFIAHGSEDTVVPAGRIDEIVAKLSARTRVKEIMGAGHSDVFERGGKDFMEEIDAFVVQEAK
jgi:hypothetical protein